VNARSRPASARDPHGADVLIAVDVGTSGAGASALDVSGALPASRTGRAGT